MFVEEVVSACHACQSGCVTLDQIVLEPKNLIGLFSSYSIRPQVGHGWSITAEGRQEMEALLYAAFRDPIDFIFVPKPAPFAIFADHDEFATFYAHTHSNLNRAVGALTRTGFEAVHDYERPQPRK